MKKEFCGQKYNSFFNIKRNITSEEIYNYLICGYQVFLEMEGRYYPEKNEIRLFIKF